MTTYVCDQVMRPSVGLWNGGWQKYSLDTERYPPIGIHMLRSDMVTRATMWKRVPCATGFTMDVYWGVGVSAGISTSRAGLARLR